jgi:hypothetical protein
MDFLMAVVLQPNLPFDLIEKNLGKRPRAIIEQQATTAVPTINAIDSEKDDDPSNGAVDKAAQESDRSNPISASSNAPEKNTNLTPKVLRSALSGDDLADLFSTKRQRRRSDDGATDEEEHE